jgi:hypothetical protein
MSQHPSILNSIAALTESPDSAYASRSHPGPVIGDSLGRTGLLDKAPAPAPGAVRTFSPWRARLPLGATYAQALAIWRHRLDTRRASNLDRVAAVHAASPAAQ